MCLTEIKPTKVILSQFQREQHLRNPLIFERARFRRFSALRPDTERTNRPTRAVISRQRPSKIKNLRVLTKDSPENRSFFGEGVKVVVEVVVDPQRQIDHFDDLGDDLRAAAKSCEILT